MGGVERDTGREVGEGRGCYSQVGVASISPPGGSGAASGSTRGIIPFAGSLTGDVFPVKEEGDGDSQVWGRFSGGTSPPEEVFSFSASSSASTEESLQQKEKGQVPPTKHTNHTTEEEGNLFKGRVHGSEAKDSNKGPGVGDGSQSASPSSSSWS